MGRPFNLCRCHQQGCLNHPIFSNLGLYAACCAHFMCHSKFWPASVKHLFSFLNSVLGLSRGKHYHTINITTFTFALQYFALSGCFLYILCYPIISPYFLLVGLLLQYVALFQSGISWLIDLLQIDVELPFQWQVKIISVFTFLFFFVAITRSEVVPVIKFLPLSPPGWRGIVVMVRAGGRSGGRLPDLWNPYLCNRLMDFLRSKFYGIV